MKTFKHLTQYRMELIEPIFDFKSLLFSHINGYWIYKYLQMAAKNEVPSDVRNPALHKKLKNIGSLLKFEEGYRVGEYLFENYLQNTTSHLKSDETSTYLEDRYPGYVDYLQLHFHAWAVPLSYREYDRAPQNEAGKPRFDKRLNLWGSTAAHDSYFSKLISRVKQHITSLPVGSRPAGFVDVGCGDGALLRHLQQELGELPDNFIYIGIDIDAASNQIASEQENGDIVYLQGDVSDPDAINDLLISQNYPALHNYFHLRAFVDHNFNPKATPASRFGENSYSYRIGDQLTTLDEIIKAYQRHFAAWKPYISNYGIGLIELHKTTLAAPGKSPSLAYEIFHFLSGQYIIEHDRFLRLISGAEWQVKDAIYQVPNDEPTVSIAIYQ